jgi:hypothetical protein
MVGPRRVRVGFGNVRNGNTLGGDKQYGKVGLKTLGAFASAIRPNPNC